MSRTLQRCLRRLYEEFDVPADVLVTTPELREEFADRVRQRAAEPGITTDKVMRLLLRLRKCGGLPRLRRGG